MERNKIKPILFLFSFIILINVIGGTIRYIEIKKQYNKEIKGIIWNITLLKGGHHYFYDKNNKKNYFIDDDFFEERFNSGIVKGDSVYKSAYNDTLYIYKKNNNQYEIYKIKVLLK